MLVIRRRAGERIVIGGNIELEVLEISKTRIRLGILAPAAVTVTRGEAMPVAAENHAASAWVSSHMNQQPAQFTALLQNLRRESVQAPADKVDQ